MKNLIFPRTGKPYKNTNLDKEDILANHKSFMSSLNIPINDENCEFIYFILDIKISEESVFKQIYSSTCSTKELSISMTRILHAVKGGLLLYCDKVYSSGNINQKHRIGGAMVSVLAWSSVDREFEPR